MNRQKLHAALTEEIRQSYKIYEGHYPAMDLAHAMAKDGLKVNDWSANAKV